ncbi:MAG: M24 family metallopeptidase [Acidiferrobacterales bacterium]|nr:M24 family metallopeptidase [Acidiferrobacterales bacterium]
MNDPTFEINRRVVLQLMASAGITAASSGLVKAQDNLPISKQASHELDPFGATGTRLNLDEAQRVMHELNLDALVLGDGRNFQQATGCLPVISKMGWPTLNVAVLIAKPEPRVLIVMLGFSYYYMAADLHTFPDSDVFLYGFVNADEINQEAALDTFRFADRGEAPLSDIEKNRLSESRKRLEQESLHSSMGQAIQAALKSADISAGRIGFDNVDIGPVLSEFIPKATLTTADDALRRIRTIKSPLEIELMRASSAINVASANAAVRQIGAGASHKDLRRAFDAELAMRGASSLFMVIDHITDEQYDADLSDGQAFVIDCVCDYLGYLGDYGRTVFIGEPQKSVLNAQVTVGKAWDLLRSQLKPGLKFSEITALGQKAMSEQGTTYRIPFKPHSVGVFHSDHYGNGASGPREDIVLRPGMIISIDCPVMETGIGGSVHLEDLMLITEDGAEPLHDVGNQGIYI